MYLAQKLSGYPTRCALWAGHAGWTGNKGIKGILGVGRIDMKVLSLCACVHRGDMVHSSTLKGRQKGDTMYYTCGAVDLPEGRM